MGARDWDVVSLLPPAYSSTVIAVSDVIPLIRILNLLVDDGYRVGAVPEM